jgi:hypothetical protein
MWFIIYYLIVLNASLIIHYKSYLKWYILYSLTIIYYIWFKVWYIVSINANKIIYSYNNIVLYHLGMCLMLNNQNKH